MGAAVSQGVKQLGNNIGAGTHAIENNYHQGVNAMNNNLTQGAGTLKKNLDNGLSNFYNTNFKTTNPLYQGLKVVGEKDPGSAFGQFAQNTTNATNKVEQNAVDNQTGIWPQGRSSPTPTPQSNAPLSAGTYNGAQTTYQSGLLPYNASLNPNTNYNINAQSNPLSNAPMAGAMKSPGVPTGGGK